MRDPDPYGTQAYWFDPTVERFLDGMGAITNLPPAEFFLPGFDIFCGGAALLPDGRALVVGGQAPTPPQYGTRPARAFDQNLGTMWPTTWVNLPDMIDVRWYPTCFTMQNGKAVAIAPNVEIHIQPEPRPTRNGGRGCQEW